MQNDPCGILEHRARLGRLAGRMCPVCRGRGKLRPLTFDGVRLRCLGEHSYSNADVAEAEICDDKPASASEMERRRAEYVALEYAVSRRILLLLEEAVGPWLPPEARTDW